MYIIIYPFELERLNLYKILIRFFHVYFLTKNKDSRFLYVADTNLLH